MEVVRRAVCALLASARSGKCPPLRAGSCSRSRTSLHSDFESFSAPFLESARAGLCCAVPIGQTEPVAGRMSNASGYSINPFIRLLKGLAWELCVQRHRCTYPKALGREAKFLAGAESLRTGMSAGGIRQVHPCSAATRPWPLPAELPAPPSESRHEPTVRKLQRR